MKKILVSALVVSIALVSCKKEEKVEEKKVETTTVQAPTTPAVDSSADKKTEDAAVKQYNKDEAEMNDMARPIELKSDTGEKLVVDYQEKPDGSRFLTYTKGTDKAVTVPIITGHDGKDAYGNDQVTLEVYDAGGKVVYTPKGGKAVTYK